MKRKNTKRDQKSSNSGRIFADVRKEFRGRMGVQFTFPSGEGGPLAVDEVLTENSIQYLSVGKGSLCAEGSSRGNGVHAGSFSHLR